MRTARTAGTHGRQARMAALHGGRVVGGEGVGGAARTDGEGAAAKNPELRGGRTEEWWWWWVVGAGAARLLGNSVPNGSTERYIVKV